MSEKEWSEKVVKKFKESIMENGLSYALASLLEREMFLIDFIRDSGLQDDFMNYLKSNLESRTLYRENIMEVLNQLPKIEPERIIKEYLEYII